MDDRKLRRVTDRAEAEELLEAWRASGERMKAWCGARGVSWFSLNAHLGWTRREAPGASKQLPALVEVSLAGTPAVVAAAVYRVDVDGLVLELGEHFDDEAVRRLVRVLASC